MKQLIYIICGLCAISTYAQKENKGDINVSFTLQPVAMLDLEPNNSMVVLNLAVPNEAGKQATIGLPSSKKWINFSSAVADNSRSISIKIEDGQVPPGIYLKLTTSNYVGIGKGILGSPSGVVTLNNISQNIITGIKGAYTGDGINNGYELTYSLEIYDYKLLDFNQSATLSISLTLSDL